MAFRVDTEKQDKEVSEMLKSRGVDMSPGQVGAMSDMLRLMNPFCYCCFNKDRASMTLCTTCKARYYCSDSEACKVFHNKTCTAAGKK